MTITMFHDEDRSLSRNDYEELQGIVISSHYGTCNHPSVKTYITTNDRKKYPDDRIPLLTNSKPLRRIARIGRHLSVRIITLGILFIGGFLVGSYLLYMQEREMPISSVMELVTREEWTANDLTAGHRLSNGNVFYVLLQHTATHGCYELTECIAFMQQYQNTWQREMNADLPFNYMIGGDGSVFEVRGWTVESGPMPVRSDLSLSIAFIGNYTEEAPSEQQLNGAKGLINEMKHQRKLAQNYRILGMRAQNNDRRDGDALFLQTSRWKNWHEIITIQTP